MPILLYRPLVLVSPFRTPTTTTTTTTATHRATLLRLDFREREDCKPAVNARPVAGTPVLLIAETWDVPIVVHLAAAADTCRTKGPRRRTTEGFFRRWTSWRSKPASTTISNAFAVCAPIVPSPATWFGSIPTAVRRWSPTAMDPT